MWGRETDACLLEKLLLRIAEGREKRNKKKERTWSLE